MKSYRSGRDWEIFYGDCRRSLQLCVPDESIQMCVTSPPYFGLRDYGVDGQIGQEQTPDEYVAALVEVFRQVRRVLKKDGTLWLNIGDSYAANRSYQVPSTKGGLKHGVGQGGGGRGSSVPQGLKQKDLIGIPWLLAFALRADEWYLRQDIIWQKPNAMPESVTDRCTKSHEYLFLLSKSKQYYFDNEALREPAVKGASGSKFNSGKTAEHQLGRSGTAARVEDGRRNKRSVWSIPTSPYAGAHFAVFPPALVEPCVLAGSRAGDTVLDPFMGSGTTAAVALSNGRRVIGCELNEDYAELIERRIGVDASVSVG